MDDTVALALKEERIEEALEFINSYLSVKDDEWDEVDPRVLLNQVRIILERDRINKKLKKLLEED